MNQCFRYCSIIPRLVLSGGSNNKKSWQQQLVGNGLGQYIVCFRIPTGFAVPVHVFFGSGYEALLNCKLSHTGLESFNSISKQKFAFIRMKRRIHLILTSYLCYCAAWPFAHAELWIMEMTMLFVPIFRKDSLNTFSELQLQKYF